MKGVVLPEDGSAASDETLRDHCRRFVKTNYHPASTARMGADDDPMAVLDAQLRVRGIQGLRVCDMSAVPDIPAGNTNAPAMMLGSRCADFIAAAGHGETGEPAHWRETASREANNKETKLNL